MYWRIKRTDEEGAVQKYMVRMMVILAVIGLFNAPIEWLRRFKRHTPGPETPAPVLHRPAA